MKKLIIIVSGLLFVVSDSFAAAAKITAPVKVDTPAEKVVPAKNNNKSVEPVKTSAPAMPVMPPAAHVQLELVKISQEFLLMFSQAEITQLSQAVESGLNKALASKDFEQAFTKLLTVVQDMAAVVASNLAVCKEIQVKLNQAVTSAATNFNKLVISGVVPVQTNEYYFVKIVNAALAGFKTGLAKVKPSKEVCATPVEPTKEETKSPAPDIYVDGSNGKIMNRKTNAQVGVVENGKEITLGQKAPVMPQAPASAPAPVK